MKRKRFFSAGVVLLLLAMMIKTIEHTPVLDKVENPQNGISEESTDREISTFKAQIEAVKGVVPEIEKLTLEVEWVVKEEILQSQGRNFKAQVSTTVGNGAVYTLQPEIFAVYGVPLGEIEDSSIYRLKDGKVDIVVAHTFKGEEYLVDEMGERLEYSGASTHLSNLVYYQGYLYYLGQDFDNTGSGEEYYPIYRVPEDGGAFEKLAESTYFFNLYNGKIYYAVKPREENEWTYYEMELDGSGKRITHVIPGMGNGGLVLGGGIIFSFSEDGIRGVNLETGQCRNYEVPGVIYYNSHSYYEDGILYFKGTTDHVGSGIYCLNVKTGEISMFKERCTFGTAIYDGYLYELFDEKIPENGNSQISIKILNLKTGESVKHVLGYFEKASPEKVEIVGDDIVLEIFIFNNKFVFYKQKVDKVWEEGFPEHWTVETNRSTLP